MKTKNEYLKEQGIDLEKDLDIGTYTKIGFAMEQYANDYHESEVKKFRLGAVSFSEDELKDFVIKLRKKHRVIEEKQFFCNDQNFQSEAEAKRSEAEVVRRIIHEMEKAFDLGFVWDKSLD